MHIGGALVACLFFIEAFEDLMRSTNRQKLAATPENPLVTIY
jgi:hypothetical protein